MFAKDQVAIVCSSAGVWQQVYKSEQVSLSHLLLDPIAWPFVLVLVLVLFTLARLSTDSDRQHCAILVDTIFVLIHHVLGYALPYRRHDARQGRDFERHAQSSYRCSGAHVDRA